MEELREQQEDPAEEAVSDLLDRVELAGAPKLSGVVLGELRGFEEGSPVVGFPGAASDPVAMTTVPLSTDQIGRQLALVFPDGDPARPLVMGLIQDPISGAPVSATVDGETVNLKGEREIRLECGKASIVLRADGKIVIKGTRLLSRASRTQRIKGGSVSIN